MGIVIVAAIRLSSIPESLSAAVMRKDGRTRRYMLGLWTAVMVVSPLAAAPGYAFLGDASGNVAAGIQAFAAGAILTMRSDNMMPEAVGHGGAVVGLVTVLGFVAAFQLSTTD